ncbi:hypothetical protein BAUCODRAFT_37984 [Baudoinia panamericana UAMH 10762]|uniref:Secreted protein n=1 Tax=Baudoinia panamericana (strain UAMH 10762) TaxID=717646 RepID=M2M9I5_BAUPA|nr:uncharacterized protein BAUCODRAFT_37984 [Baudoinia panamericana UAMH 10762]EMC93066.1 hypothetical protein BAUCODRAFT_37984 [Baudoinia panamericana UAMH 10762]
MKEVWVAYLSVCSFVGLLACCIASAGVNERAFGVLPNSCPKENCTPPILREPVLCFAACAYVAGWGRRSVQPEGMEMAA